MTLTSQHAELVRKFPASYIKQKPGRFSADYVEHGDITQRLLEVVGPFNFHIVDVVRDGDGAIIGVLANLECTIDGRTVSITEAGESENPNGPLKSATSDALKRCAMRLGLGLHLWCQDHYYLDKKITAAQENDE